MARLTHVGRLSKSRKLGIGGRLILSFAIVAVLTAGAGSASSWLAIRGATIMDRIGSRTLPTVTASLTFAQRSSVLAAAAPALALQKDQASLQSEGAKLKALIAEQKSRIAELRSLMENSSMLDPIEKSSDQLAGKIGEIETLASKRADLTDAIDKKVSETLSAHQDFTDAVHPLVELTQTVVDRSLGDITSEDATRTGSIAARLKSKEMPALKALMDLEAAGNIVNGMLAAAANAPNNDSSTDIRTQYEWGELSLNQDVETLGAGFGEGKLASTGKALLADGSGRDSIFALRERRVTTDADIAASLEALVKITSTLAHQVEQLVESEKSAAAESVLESGAVARQSLLVNAVLSGIVVLVSALIGWLYVGRVVVRRLNSLASNMGRLATGDISVEINSWGDDEITAMARSVEVFKNNIIRGDELAREADVNASDRESIRTRTDAERATAAEEQAAVVAGLAAGLSHLAKGDLTYELHDAFPEDYEALREDFNLTVSQLRSVMQQIVVNSLALQTGAGEISAAADNLSRRTEQQAASLEETAAALGQITATVRQTAQGANHVQEIVGTAKVDVELSGQVVREAVDAMSGIEQSSAKISQIISVIDEIAFQTNLLALNAGVEAARAGDSGRGFAVVASEVRALAQRSAGAAKEIKALILASEQQVDRGVSLVGQTGQVLERIVGQVAKINAIVVEIAASAKEQATGLHQVNTAVNEMDQVTQQNAAMVEQSTAASHALARETQDLNRLISRFEVNKPGIVGSSEGVRRASSPGVRTRSFKTVAENGMPLRPTKPNRDYRASA